MTDMLKTIAPKSDQLNFDDFAAGQSKTIKVTKVSGITGEQPIAIGYEGDNGKPYMPCKSMRRVLVNCWGPDGHQYVGRSMTLYGDPKVKFGGLEVGGIRISHLSHIKDTVTLALTATKASRKPFTVKPLEEMPQEKSPTVDNKMLETIKMNLAEAAKHGTEALQMTWTKLDPKFQKALEAFKEEYKEVAKKADEK